MLVLTRKAKQQVQIGPNVTLTILQVKGQAVRIGIEAPQNVTVLRTELAERLADEPQDAPAPLDADVAATISAALEKAEREAEINRGTADEQQGGRTKPSATASLRCRAPRADVAPLTSPYQATGSASLLRPRRRRLLMK